MLRGTGDILRASVRQIPRYWADAGARGVNDEAAWQATGAALVRLMSLMVTHTDPPAYLYLDGLSSAVSRGVDRFPIAKTGFTFACWYAARSCRVHAVWPVPDAVA